MKYILLLISFVFVYSSELYSRYLINVGDLYVDKGRYLEAIDNYDSAYVSSSSDFVKLEAQIKKANVLYMYLLKPRDAFEVLYSSYKKFKNVKNSEYALFFSAMIAKDFNASYAKDIFREYLLKYPDGRFSFQAKFFYKRIKKTPFHTKTLAIKEEKPKIRVLLLKSKKVSLRGAFFVDREFVSHLNCKVRGYKICCNGICKRNFFVKSQKASFVEEENRKYEGDFKLVYKDGKIYLINLVPIDQYLYSVVTSESLNSWDLEALKSQAVASRTFVFYQTKVRKNWLYDVRDDTFDQVYKGIETVTKKSIKAVEETKGEILTYDNKVILSQFCANVGWRSSSSKEIFGVEFPYLYSHKDEFSVKMPRGKWVKKVSVKDLENSFKKMGLNLGKISKIVPYKRVKSGRIVKIKVYSSKGVKILKTYTSLRRAAKLYDILLTEIEKDGNYFIFKGGGYGHGVGYSQWGAEAMAKEGYGYREILEFYYKNVKIKKLW